MYDDSHASFSDPSPISPLQKQEQQKLQLMESDYRQQSESSGLLRFRSAPTSLLENLTEKKTKSSKLGVSRFCSDEANGMKMAENEYSDDGCNEGSGNNGFGGMNSPLPRQHPRQSVAQMGYRIGSSLMRQNSSPAGLISLHSSQNGYSEVQGIVNWRVVDGDGNIDSSPTPSNIFKNHTNLSSMAPSLLPRISEVENENGGPNSNGDNLFFNSGFPLNDSSYSSDPKPERFDHPVNMLSRHSSQDTVPCKVRAKRGCATHPRSIAERVRRTRISERMRMLQELVPNMDKQTNTADMLDLAVEYIKGLQKQYKTLNYIRANCKCSAFPKFWSVS